MKLKQLVNGGALAATVLTLGSAQADPYDGIVFCKATLMSSADSLESVSITLPFNATTSEGEAYTYWNLGTVAAGGVADSWHSEGGPGKFVAHNNGGTGVYVYLTSSGCGNESWSGGWVDPDYIFGNADEFLNTDRIYPVPSLQAWKALENVYCLAFSKDVTAKIPTWHMLDRFSMNGMFSDGWLVADSNDWSRFEEVEYIGAYMGYLDAGDYMAFDVKFWAPQAPSKWDYVEQWDYRQGVRFTFMVTAAPFPLWEHDREVQ